MTLTTMNALGQYLFLGKRLLHLLLVINMFMTFTSGISNIRVIGDSGCPCPEEYLVFECRVEGGRGEATQWQISNCDREVILRHSKFINNTASGTACNTEGKSARIENNSTYISVLNVSVNYNSIGESVSCFKFSLSSNMWEIVGHITVPFYRPEYVQLIRKKPQQLIFGWNTIETSCSSLHYNIVSDCGVCQNTTTFNMTTCEISQNILFSETCFFQVEPVFCDYVKGYKSELKIYNTSTFACDLTSLTDVFHGQDGLNVLCKPHLMSLRTKDSLICYNGTSIGSKAYHFCICDHHKLQIQADSVWTCTNEGYWNGSFTQCKCGSPDKISDIDVPVGLYAGIATTSMLILMLAIALVMAIIYSLQVRRAEHPRLSNGQSKVEEPVYEEIRAVSTEGELYIKMDDNGAYSTT